jgi:hypothetical protein
MAAYCSHAHLRRAQLGELLLKEQMPACERQARAAEDRTRETKCSLSAQRLSAVRASALHQVHTNESSPWEWRLKRSPMMLSLVRTQRSMSGSRYAAATVRPKHSDASSRSCCCATSPPGAAATPGPEAGSLGGVGPEPGESSAGSAACEAGNVAACCCCSRCRSRSSACICFNSATSVSCGRRGLHEHTTPHGLLQPEVAIDARVEPQLLQQASQRLSCRPQLQADR